jgi:hypothetical protein
MEVSGQLQASAAFPTQKQPGTYWIGGWMGPNAEVDALSPTGNRTSVI